MPPTNMRTCSDDEVADTRAYLFRLRVPHYLVAARLRINTIRFSQLLNHHLPLSQTDAARIRAAAEEVARELAAEAARR